MPAGHPLRVIRAIVNATLVDLSPVFAKLYAPLGRPSIPPEQLLRALLLQAFYSIRSERQLMERLDFDLLFRWFVGLGIDDAVWDHSTFSKNRDRLLEGDVAAEFLATLLDRPEVRRLLSSEHFSVDGTLIQAWASMKSFRPKDGVGRAAERRAQRRAATSAASGRRTRPTPRPPIPDALLYRKGAGHGGEALLHRPRADGEPQRSRRRCRADPRLGSCRAAGGAGHGRPPADRRPGHARRRQGLRRPGLRRRAARAPGDTARRPEYSAAARSAIDGRTTPPCQLCPEPAGEEADRGSLRLDQDDVPARRGRGCAAFERVRWSFTLAATAYNLVRLPKLLAGSG